MQTLDQETINMLSFGNCRELLFIEKDLDKQHRAKAKRYWGEQRFFVCETVADLGLSTIRDRVTCLLRGYWQFD